MIDAGFILVIIILIFVIVRNSPKEMVFSKKRNDFDLIIRSRQNAPESTHIDLKSLCPAFLAFAIVLVVACYGMVRWVMVDPESFAKWFPSIMFLGLFGTFALCLVGLWYFRRKDKIKKF